MKKIIAILLALSAVTALASCNQATDTETDTVNDTETTDTADADDAVSKLTPDAKHPAADADVQADTYTSLADFCNSFISAAAKNQGEDTNILSSPLSAYFALSMVKEGAAGVTLDEFNASMGEVSGEEMYALISHLTSLESTVLNIANSVWIDLGFDVNEDYLNALSEYYLAEAYSAVLKNAENSINLWISDKTNGLIKNMLSDKALDSALMALVNTVYMDAKWMDEFSEKATHESEFHNSDGTVSITDFMHSGPENELVIANDSFTGIVLPYTDGSLKFVAVMPESETDCISEEVAEWGGFKALADTAEWERTILFLPVFEQNSAVSLNEVLMSMGIVSAFTDEANFSGIADEIKIDAVLQNTVLKVDEAGTEAAAATVVSMKATSAAPPKEEPRTLKFDRPFAFAVIDDASGAVLFAGEHNVTE